MKIVAATTLAVLALGAQAESTSLRQELLSMGSGCTNSYVCPANSYRKPNRQCYDTFDDCNCEEYYIKKDGKCLAEVEIVINNLSFQQPFSSFFVMVHSKDLEPLYRQGQPASEPLAILAEDGNPDALVKEFQHKHGVYEVRAVPGPVLGGESTSFKLYVNDDYRVTIATMAINTNDCFASLNGVAIAPGDVFNLPGLDAGSEENNELCTSIPGPACSPNSGNIRSGNGEGFVHVHRGFHGINEDNQHLRRHELGANGQPLSAIGYDWRNPLMRVTVRSAYGGYH